MQEVDVDLLLQQTLLRRPWFFHISGAVAATVVTGVRVRWHECEHFW